jgi:tellurite methyltransferase
MTTDAERWDRRWGARDEPPGPPHPLVRSLADRLPPGSAVLDVAAGRGRQALALSDAGHDVLAVDISTVGLDQLIRNANRAVRTRVLDLSTPLAGRIRGPFAAVVCVDFRAAHLWADLRGLLAPDGVLLVSMATTTNLERHPKPSRRFLASSDDGPAVLGDLLIEVNAADWRENGRHELWIQGRRAT